METLEIICLWSGSWGFDPKSFLLAFAVHGKSKSMWEMRYWPEVVQGRAASPWRLVGFDGLGRVLPLLPTLDFPLPASASLCWSQGSIGKWLVCDGLLSYHVFFFLPNWQQPDASRQESAYDRSARSALCHMARASLCFQERAEKSSTSWGGLP